MNSKTIHTLIFVNDDVSDPLHLELSKRDDPKCLYDERFRDGVYAQLYRNCPDVDKIHEISIHVSDMTCRPDVIGVVVSGVNDAERSKVTITAYVPGDVREWSSPCHMNAVQTAINILPIVTGNTDWVKDFDRLSDDRYARPDITSSTGIYLNTRLGVDECDFAHVLYTTRYSPSGVSMLAIDCSSGLSRYIDSDSLEDIFGAWSSTKDLGISRMLAVTKQLFVIESLKRAHDHISAEERAQGAWTPDADVEKIISDMIYDATKDNLCGCRNVNYIRFASTYAHDALTRAQDILCELVRPISGKN